MCDGEVANEEVTRLTVVFAKVNSVIALTFRSFD